MDPGHYLGGIHPTQAGDAIVASRRRGTELCFLWPAVRSFAVPSAPRFGQLDQLEDARLLRSFWGPITALPIVIGGRIAIFGVLHGFSRC
jgi:hypothetical protein